jgi:hypothetical protein
MQAWWEHNKNAVLLHQYDQATWLPDSDQEKPQDAPIFTQDESPQPSPPAPTPTPARVIANLPEKVNSGWGMTQPLVIVAVIFGSGFMLFRLLMKK